MSWHKDWMGRTLKQLLLEEGESSKRQQPYSSEHPLRGHRLYDVCPMEEALCSIHSVVRDSKKVHPALKAIFTMGTGIHTALQDHLLAPYLVGAWRCNGCSKLYRHEDGDVLIRRPKRCTSKKCPNSNWEEDVVNNWHLPGFSYIEREIKHSQPHLVCHVDGLISMDTTADVVNIADPSLEVLEIKSSGSKSWDSLYKSGEPVPAHMYQLQMYMGLLGVKRGRLLYVNKGGYTMGNMFLEFEVVLDPEEHEQRMQRLHALHLAAAKSDPRGLYRACDSEECARSKACAVSGLCWQVGG